MLVFAGDDGVEDFDRGCGSVLGKKGKKRMWNASTAKKNRPANATTEITTTRSQQRIFSSALLPSFSDNCCYAISNDFVVFETHMMIMHSLIRTLDAQNSNKQRTTLECDRERE